MTFFATSSNSLCWQWYINLIRVDAPPSVFHGRLKHMFHCESECSSTSITFRWRINLNEIFYHSMLLSQYRILFNSFLSYLFFNIFSPRGVNNMNIVENTIDMLDAILLLEQQKQNVHTMVTVSIRE